MEKRRMVIYQLLPRLFGNKVFNNKVNGSLEENGCGKFNDINNEALQSIAELGATHVWFTGIIEHATCTDYSDNGIAKDYPDIVKGVAGSPYAIKDYYDVDPDLSVDVSKRMQEFEALVERTHANDLQVIIDLVPNHLARNYVSDAAPKGIEPFGSGDDKSVPFSKDNNFYYLPGTDFISPEEPSSDKQWQESPARATGNDCFSASPAITDWYETVKLNYGVDYVGKTPADFDPEPDTWLKMRDVVLYWAAKGVDGFRCDMAGMVPIDFWRWMIGEVRKTYPRLLFIAEVYDAEHYNDYIFKAGFDYLYDKVVLYDGLRAVMEGTAPASSLSACWQQTDGLHHFLLYFLENHDEQRLASDFFMGSGEKAIPGMTVAAAMFNNPLLIYAGQEIGERGTDAEGYSGADGRTTIFDYWGVERLQQWQSSGNWSGTELPESAKALREFYQKLLSIIQQGPALNKGRFYDLMWANTANPAFNGEKIFAYLRYEGGRQYLVVANFGGMVLSYKLRIPADAMDVTGMKSHWYYSGEDLLGLNRKIQFPAVVAQNGGLGGKLEPYSAAIYELKGSEVDF
ncbi:alpha-amylase family protein [Geofilum rubicundum]|uniref:Alpha-amylase n=1 Tax=Geofilum rubicundum JCM 15548 TaxID=1236989 RepID=A0A0E9M2Q4_9BACT|nr:alpha-amylase family protein [Geofilum rubicundum]GAO31395.1 alpha-amylase [Geofilum rubicundum JCM 15548]